jgi:hypothetical protein
LHAQLKVVLLTQKLSIAQVWQPRLCNMQQAMQQALQFLMFQSATALQQVL